MVGMNLITGPMKQDGKNKNSKYYIKVREIIKSMIIKFYSLIK